MSGPIGYASPFGTGSRDRAEAKIRTWSLGALESSPGLKLAVVHVEYENGELQQVFHKARHLLEERENELQFGYQLGTLPIARPCPSTALAANSFDELAEGGRDEWLNVEALRKREAERRLRADDPLTQKYNFPRDIDQIGVRKGDSLIAVVHADGDGIGKELNCVMDASYANDDEFAKALKTFSNALSELSIGARERLCQDLNRLWPEILDCGLIEGTEFPLRPVVGAGDDITFITPAKLGLSLAARYLEIFTDLSGKLVKKSGGHLTASTGVLLMPLKFPFARGYKLAEDLTRAAKDARRRAGSDEPFIDFHVLHEGITGSLEEIRGHYTIDGRDKLLKRPYMLSDFSQKFTPLWQHLYGRWPRSSSKALLEAVVRGQKRTQARLGYFAARHLTFPSGLEIPPGGWRDHNTPLFDPLELLDHHAPVDWETGRLAIPPRATKRNRTQVDAEGTLAYV